MFKQSVNSRKSDGGDSKIIDFANPGFSGCAILVFLKFLEVFGKSDFRESFRYFKKYMRFLPPFARHFTAGLNPSPPNFRPSYHFLVSKILATPLTAYWVPVIYSGNQARRTTHPTSLVTKLI